MYIACTLYVHVVVTEEDARKACYIYYYGKKLERETRSEFHSLVKNERPPVFATCARCAIKISISPRYRCSGEEEVRGDGSSTSGMKMSGMKMF